MMSRQRRHDVADPVGQSLRQTAIKHRLPAERDIVGTDRQRPQPDRQRYHAIAFGDARREREDHLPGVEPLLARCGAHDAFGGDAIDALRGRIVGLRETARSSKKPLSVITMASVGLAVRMIWGWSTFSDCTYQGSISALSS